MASTDDQVAYVCPSIPYKMLKVAVDDDTVVVQFEGGRAVVTKPVSEALDKLFASRPQISRGITKVDRAAAEKLALEHKAQRQAAIKGGITSASGFTNKSTPENMAQQMQQLGGDAESSAKAADAVTSVKTTK